MTAERAGGSKLAKLMAYHILRNIDGNVGLAIVHSDGQAYHIGDDHGSA